MGLPDLEIKCFKCWGSGLLAAEENHGSMTECPECEGIGWLPTEDGEKLLLFLQRHLAFDVEDFDDEEEVL